MSKQEIIDLYVSRDYEMGLDNQEQRDSHLRKLFYIQDEEEKSLLQSFSRKLDVCETPEEMKSMLDNDFQDYVISVKEKNNYKRQRIEALSQCQSNEAFYQELTLEELEILGY